MLLVLVLFLILTSTLADPNFQRVLQMARDFEHFCGAKSRATVLESRDLTVTGLSESLLFPGSVVLSDSFEETISVIATMGNLDGFDFLVFPTSFRNATLALTTLEERVNIFQSKAIVLLPNQGDWSSLKLRLDTQLYYYDIHTEAIIIHEVYAVRNGARIHREIGFWNQSLGLTIYEPSLWQRRHDLMGAQIRNGLMTWSVFNSMTLDKRGVVTSNVGIFADAMNRLAAKLNFTEVIYESKDKKWGGLNADGKTWNGLINMLQHDEIDISTAGLTQFQERDAVIDFTIPLAEEGTTLIALRNQGQSTQFWVYFEIFPIHVWIIIVSIVILLAIVFYAISTTGMNVFHAQDDFEKFTLLNSLAVNGLLVLQISYSIVLTSFSSKALFMFSSFLAYLIFTYYTCDLTARMTSGPPPFQSSN